MTFGMTLAEHLTMAASANMFYFAVDQNEPNMKVAASNVKKTYKGIKNSKKESIKHENGSQLFEFRLLY